MIPRIGTILLGLWLIVAPGVFGLLDPARSNDYIVGPLIVSFATVALWEATRGLRWVNFLLGVWLLLAPFVLGYPFPIPVANDILVGLAVLVLATRGGKITQRFGGGWSAIFRKEEALSGNEQR